MSKQTNKPAATKTLASHAIIIVDTTRSVVRKEAAADKKTGASYDVLVDALKAGKMPEELSDKLVELLGYDPETATQIVKDESAQIAKRIRDAVNKRLKALGYVIRYVRTNAAGESKGMGANSPITSVEVVAYEPKGSTKATPETIAKAAINEGAPSTEPTAIEVAQGSAESGMTEAKLEAMLINTIGSARASDLPDTLIFATLLKVANQLPIAAANKEKALAAE